MTREHWLSFDESSDGLTGLRWLLICFAVCFSLACSLPPVF